MQGLHANAALLCAGNVFKVRRLQFHAEHHKNILPGTKCTVQSETLSGLFETLLLSKSRFGLTDTARLEQNG